MNTTNTSPNDDTDSEGGDTDITKLSALQLAANLMTSLLVESLNALKANPSTENLTVARQTLQGLRYPIEPMDDIDAGLAQELKQRYLKAIHKAINEPGATPALMREVLRYQTAVGLLSASTANGSALGHAGTAQGRIGHLSTPLVERMDERSVVEGPNGMRLPAGFYDDLPFGAPAGEASVTPAAPIGNSEPGSIMTGADLDLPFA